MASVIWFRRDLRTRDHPALLAADRSALGLFVLDKRLVRPSRAPRLAFLHRCLRDLNEQLNDRLLVVSGDPVELVPRIAKQINASSVHVSADTAPYGRERDANVEKALGEIDFIRSGSPYAVTPGRVTKADGTPYRVFTPFAKAWADHGWRRPADTDASTVDWIEPPRISDATGDRTDGTPGDKPGDKARHQGDPLDFIEPQGSDIFGGVEIPDLPAAGERAAPDAWATFRDERLEDYASQRDRPDKPGTSRMSPYLKPSTRHAGRSQAQYLPHRARVA